MAIPQRRTQRERTEESARRLAEAAVALIAEKGYSKTTAREIGVRAGYSRAMVAERFGTKDALLDYILEREYEARIDVDPGPGATGFQRLIAPIEALQTFAEQDPQLLRAMLVLNFEAVHDPGILRQRIQQWLTRFQQTLADAVRAGQSDGSIAAGLVPGDVSRDILSAGIGYAYLWIVTPESLHLPTVLGQWRRRIAQGVASPAERRKQR